MANKSTVQLDNGLTVLYVDDQPMAIGKHDQTIITNQYHNAEVSGIINGYVSGKQVYAVDQETINKLSKR